MIVNIEFKEYTTVTGESLLLVMLNGKHIGCVMDFGDYFKADFYSDSEGNELDESEFGWIFEILLGGNMESDSNLERLKSNIVSTITNVWNSLQSLNV